MSIRGIPQPTKYAAVVLGIGDHLPRDIGS